MSFLKKTNLGATAPAAKTPTLGAKKLGGGLKKSIKPTEINIEEEEPVAVTPAKTIPAAGKLGAKKKLGGGLKKTIEPTPEPVEEVKETPVVETTELKVEETPAPKKKLGAKKLGAKKATEVEIEPQVEEKVEAEENIKVDEAGNVTIEAETLTVKDAEGDTTIKVDADGEVVEEKTTKKKSTRKTSKKTTAKKEEEAVVAALEVDESKRVSIDEMDTVMRPIVAPTTEDWEQEKQDVLEALNNIKVEQDMEMSQVKSCLADLDELNFEVLPKLHDAETMYDGTKQNYDTVKAVAIAKGSATNSEGRKAEGILACQNFVTPTGAVVDLHQYMLLIEERYKFYQKVSDGISFKKYSLVNYNNALKVESKNA